MNRAFYGQIRPIGSGIWQELSCKKCGATHGRWKREGVERNERAIHNDMPRHCRP